LVERQIQLKNFSHCNHKRRNCAIVLTSFYPHNQRFSPLPSTHLHKHKHDKSAYESGKKLDEQKNVKENNTLLEKKNEKNKENNI
jgi:hypothetical protein